MKRNFLITLLLVLVASSVSYATPLTAAGNPHNMSGLVTTTGVKAVAPAYPGESSADQICVFCHTPHSASPKSTLWSRPDPTGPNGDGTFPLYGQSLGIKTAPGLTGYNSALNYPNGSSRMCLSCHDGFTSVGVLLGNQTIAMEGGLTNLTTNVVNLASSHPISFKYNQDVVTAVLDPDAYRLPDGSVDTPLDGLERMQCTTCHDPHEDTSLDDNYGRLPFWRHQGAASSYDDVCEACHWNTSAGSSVVPGTPPHLP